ncbi:MAG: hypothetical protein ACKOQ6_13685 [Bacteroidota bacterium]
MCTRLTLLLSVLLLSAGIKAQNTVNTPFSSYGFGERTYGTDPVTSALGASAITYLDSTIVNLNNPSSYNLISQGQPLFSVGFRSRISQFEQNSDSYSSGVAMVDHFAMAFSIRKHFGLAFGLKPYARRGYELTTKELVGTDSLRYTYLGYGGSNEAFLGLTSTIFKLKKSHLSVGANLGYLFGNATNERRSSIVDNESFLGGVDRKSIRFKSFHYELGAYFRQDFGDKNSLILSSVIEPAQEISGFRSETLFFAGNVNNAQSYAVLYDTSNVEGFIKLAPSCAFGLTYSLRTSSNDDNRTRNSEFLFTGSYTTTDWSQFYSRFDGSDEQFDYTATRKLSLGIQYTPEFQQYGVNTGFFERLRYRAGYYSFNMPYKDSGKDINEFGTTFGIGMPITAQQSLSSLNLGITLGKRGNGESSGFNERFIGINFGIIVAPSNYDRWFRKRKLD